MFSQTVVVILSTVYHLFNQCGSLNLFGVCIMSCMNHCLCVNCVHVHETALVKSISYGPSWGSQGGQEKGNGVSKLRIETHKHTDTHNNCVIL